MWLKTRDWHHFYKYKVFFFLLVTASFYARANRRKSIQTKMKRWWHAEQERWISSAYCTKPWGVVRPCFMALKRTKATTEPLKLRTIHLKEPNTLNWLYICRVCDRKTMLTWQISNISLNGWVKSKVTARILICLWLRSDQWLQGSSCLSDKAMEKQESDLKLKPEIWAGKSMHAIFPRYKEHSRKNVNQAYNKYI